MALMLKTEEKKLVLKAIDDLGRRVTVADVAAKTGLPVLVANAELNQVASETQGHLQVSAKGDIAYEFAPGFQNIYLATGIRKTLQDVGKKIFDIGFAILRASFGVMLVLSFIAVILLIIVAILAMNSGKDGDRDGGGLDFDFFDFMIFRDLLFWGSTSYYPPYVDYNSPSSTRPAAKSNFLHNCFSFLFGDGDPNAHLDERQWQLVAQVIRKFHGIVTAEQIAPYTGADPKNEDGILPVLVRFNGVPEVTDNGHILYTFPSLQVSASRLEIATTPAFLREFPRQFTNASSDELIPVYILAGVNFLGSWWLLSQSTSEFSRMHPFLPLISALVIYGTFFVGVPTVRYLCLQVINQRIEARNDKKKEAASIVNNPDKDLQLKLVEAKNHQIKHTQIAQNDSVYTTEKDMLEQEFDT
jgi:hypothetical protein